MRWRRCTAEVYRSVRFSKTFKRASGSNSWQSAYNPYTTGIYGGAKMGGLYDSYDQAYNQQFASQYAAMCASSSGVALSTKPSDMMSPDGVMHSLPGKLNSVLFVLQRLHFLGMHESDIGSTGTRVTDGSSDTSPPSQHTGDMQASPGIMPPLPPQHMGMNPYAHSGNIKATRVSIVHNKRSLQDMMDQYGLYGGVEHAMALNPLAAQMHM